MHQARRLALESNAVRGRAHAVLHEAKKASLLKFIPVRVTMYHTDRKAGGALQTASAQRLSPCLNRWSCSGTV
jgi:hypothetical protein